MNKLLKTSAIAIIMGCTYARPIAAQEALHIDNNGNLGIGNISPNLDKPEPKREKSVIFQQILVCGTSDLPLCV